MSTCKQLSLLILAILLVGCAGSSPLNTSAGIGQPQAGGGEADGYSVHREGGTITVGFTELSTAGEFISLPVTEPLAVASSHWTGDSQVLHLAVATTSELEIGVVPLGGNTAGGELTINTIDARTTAAVQPAPPGGEENSIENLFVGTAGFNQVRLEWRELHVGDYNLDGLVSLSDLTPVAVHFGERTATTGGTAPQWVDGNGDGVITLGDLTAISHNYGSALGGYIVRRNGNVVPGTEGYLPTVPRPTDVNHSEPPFYSLLLGGSIEEEWTVTPVDWRNNEGVVSKSAKAVELLVSVAIDGVPLRELGEIAIGESGSGRLLRIIDPGEIVNNFDLRDRLQIPHIGNPVSTDTDIISYVGIPKDQQLFVDIVYLPTVDLATGEPVPDTPQAWEEFGVVTAVPFLLPKTELAVRLDVNISLEANPAGGYYIVVSSTQTIGEEVTMDMTRLSYATGLVSRITSAGTTFDEAAELSDDDRDAVSQSRIEQLMDEERLISDWTTNIHFEGVVSSFDEASGELHVTDGYRISAVGTIPVPDFTVLFTELTLFAEKQGPDGDLTPVDPSDLAAGDRIELAVEALDDGPGGEYARLWANSIVRVLP
jgi:hypothetical protein